MFVYKKEKNPVGIELFSHVKTSFYSKQFAKLLTSLLNTIYRKFKMQWQRERKKSNSLTRQNNNFARASRVFVHFFAVTARLPRENT